MSTHCLIIICNVSTQLFLTPEAGDPEAPGDYNKAGVGSRADTDIHTVPPILPHLQLEWGTWKGQVINFTIHDILYTFD